eukprot:1180154-Prorocentrum_minimum.AAC.3
MADAPVSPRAEDATDATVPAVSYATLEQATNKWAKRVGQGGFGEVFSGTLNGRKVGGEREENVEENIFESNP